MSAIDFTLPPLDTGYLSNPVRNDTAFDSSVKYFTDLFLDSVLQNDIVPQSILDTFDFVSEKSPSEVQEFAQIAPFQDDIDPFVDALVENWDEVLTTNWRILTAITFGLFMALVLPITGAIWCCCSCICRKEPKPRKGSDRMVMCTLVRVLRRQVHHGDHEVVKASSSRGGCFLQSSCYAYCRRRGTLALTCGPM